MISFRKYLLIMENNGYNNPYETILTALKSADLDIEELVRFAYSSANTIRSYMDNRGLRVLDLAWATFFQNKNIPLSTLDAAFNAATSQDNNLLVYMANFSASRVAETIMSYSDEEALSHAASAAETASYVYAHVNKDSEDLDIIRNQIVDQFIKTINSIKINKTYKSDALGKSFIKEGDVLSLSVWFDRLEEDGSEFVKKFKQLVQNLEGFINIKDNQDLARVIHNSIHKDYYIQYIKKSFI